MFKFRDNNDITHMCFVKAKLHGATVKMYATADTNDAFGKVSEYKKEGYEVYATMKPIVKMDRKGNITYD